MGKSERKRGAETWGEGQERETGRRKREEERRSEIYLRMDKDLENGGGG